MATIPGAMFTPGDTLDESAGKIEGLLGGTEPTEKSIEEVEDKSSETDTQDTEEVTEETEVEETEVEETEVEDTESEDSDEDADQNETDTESEEEEDTTDIELPVFAKLLGIEENALEVDDDGNIFVSTKIDGEPGKVNIPDLIKSYQLQGHVNKKSEELAQARKEFDTQKDQLLNEYGAKLNEQAGFISALEQAFMSKYNGIDWADLQANDPARYAALQVEATNQKTKIEALRNSINQESLEFQQNQQNQYMERMQKKVADEKEALLQAMPEWKNSTLAQQEAGKIGNYLKNAGFNDGEIDSIVDHRALLIARKAMLYDDLQNASETAKVKRVKKTMKVVKPGAARTTKQKRDDNYIAKQKKLQKSGHVDDAAALFFDLID